MVRWKVSSVRHITPVLKIGLSYNATSVDLSVHVNQEAPVCDRLPLCELGTLFLFLLKLKQSSPGLPFKIQIGFDVRKPRMLPYVDPLVLLLPPAQP
mgnify:CR=1 FL=1